MAKIVSKSRKKPTKTIAFPEWMLKTNRNEITYSWTKREWLRRLSYFTKPHQYEGIPKTNFTYGPGSWGKLRNRYRVVDSILYTGKQIQNSILRGNWHAAVEFLKILLTQHLNRSHLRFIFQSIHTVLLNHPSSSPRLASHFESLTSSFKDCSRPSRRMENNVNNN
ncbi:Protein of unknown function [Gryllus bimaculatus]|nr:Protein of unknown function [Gryllus bimaculatus]